MAVVISAVVVVVLTVVVVVLTVSAKQICHPFFVTVPSLSHVKVSPDESEDGKSSTVSMVVPLIVRKS